MPLLIPIALCAFVVAVAALGPRRLRLKRDYFFLLFLAQAVIYVVVMPSLNVRNGATDVTDAYLRLESYAALLFVIPLILVYRLFWRRGPTVDPPVIEITTARAAIFAAMLVAFDIAFLVVAFQNDMVFTRIGTYPLAAHQAALPLLALLVIRSHDLIALPLVGYLLFLQLHFRRSGGVSRRALNILLAPLLVGAGVLAFTAVLSSRGTIVIAATFLLGTYLFYSGASGVRLRILVPYVIAVSYLLLLVPNVRTWQASGDNVVELLWPTYAIDRYSPAPATIAPNASGPLPTIGPGASAQPPTADQRVVAYVDEGFVRRLDCIDLIQRMEPSLARSGFELGAAWRVPAFIALTEFVAPGASEEYKRTARTTAKSYLLERHTDLDPGDYYSCSLTDLYGNFGPVGFPIGAALLGVAFTLLRPIMRGHLPLVPSHAYWIGLLLAAHLVTFEQEFITFLVGWIRYLPAAAALLLINPAAVRGGAPAPLYRIKGLLRRLRAG
jgi:hypothetical protein